ncbi:MULTISPECIES: GGDEF domain-containing protein [Vibrio]|jgi:diguanylate cyclase (GGDEF)-like protein|uniref:Diguanylate cyclase n=2 Tax=Vibrio campbellii TaxID=680 RepID=A0ACC7RFV5_9VIBR|nr:MULTISPECIES: GGDEF domain-containing protein [Vibrio]EDL70297.1 ggdef domain containing protein [Vibrio campbellii HY01]APX06294.1 GGDEF domain-containing protein [Vibrio campbellii]ARR44559.1 GGDEF domain-containing protein [Vibrio campbellii]AUV86255.1 GGDEF domain-containing protein [Vibrio campbellii]AUW05088.1 GGDEF domain-containing protein [Vibrio campbellii]
MSEITLDIADFHWVTQILDTMDSGLIVLDQDYKVCVWNSFMQSYSGILSQNILGECLFDHFEELPRTWLETKLKTSADLETRSFSSWENRPYLFKFNNFSPVSNSSNLMFQDIVITPLRSLSGDVSHIAIQINDVSETARNRIHLRETNQHLSEISRKDGLTGLFNRAYWEQSLKEEFAQLKVIEGASSLVIFDIDHFKKVNDTYGHHTGDEVIRRTSSLLRKTARSSDICGRFGGEEFTVLLPHTNQEQANYFAERLRKRIEQEIVKVEEFLINYTISIGVCEYKSYFESHTQWLKSADAALYRAKESGRNQTCNHEDA